MIVGSLLTICTQQEHQVAVKQRPKYLYLKSLIPPSLPDLLSRREPKPAKQSIMVVMPLILYNFLILIQWQSVLVAVNCFLLSLIYNLSISSPPPLLHSLHPMRPYRRPTRTTPPIRLPDSLGLQAVQKDQYRTKDNRQANRRLKAFILQSKQSLHQQNFERKIWELFKSDKNQKQDSETLTISTQESQNSKDFFLKQEKPKLEAIKQKYQQTVKSISKELEPMKETFSRTKDRLITSGSNIKQKIATAQMHYANFSAQLPPLTSFTIKSVKQTFGGLMSNFF